MYDIVIPKNNELELAKRAKEFGFSEIIFLYKNIKDSKYQTGILIEPKKKSDLNQPFLRRNAGERIIVAKSDASEEINRAVLETPGITMAINLSSSTGRDHTHYRRGGVNQVLAKLAKENNISYALDFSRLLNTPQRVLLLGRWMQNIRVFKKYKVPVDIFSFADKPEDLRNRKDLEAFARILGT